MNRNEAIPRLEKAFCLLGSKNVVPLSFPYAIVYSQSSEKRYLVNYHEKRCTCPDHYFMNIVKEQGVKCKHLRACELQIMKQELNL